VDRLAADAGSDPDRQAAQEQLRQVRMQDPRSETWDQAAAHDFADQLEELLPLVADETHLRVLVRRELVQSPEEPWTLKRLFGELRLAELEAFANPGTSPCDAAAAAPDPRGRREMAEVLSLLAKERNGYLRHERLMDQLRPVYLVWLGGSLMVSLIVLFVGIVVGGVSSTSQALAPWAQLLLAVAAGSAGSVLGATLRLRDVVTLVSFRSAVRLVRLQPLVGAIFGLLGWLLSSSGLITLGGTDGPDRDTTTGWATLILIAFAAGFSEPFALGIIKRASVTGQATSTS
jgi:hypothetical protein